MEPEWISMASSLFATRVQYFVEQTKEISRIGGKKELSHLAAIPLILLNKFSPTHHRRILQKVFI
jgi:hypothetical protein